MSHSWAIHCLAPPDGSENVEHPFLIRVKSGRVETDLGALDV